MLLILEGPMLAKLIYALFILTNGGDQTLLLVKSKPNIGGRPPPGPLSDYAPGECCHNFSL